MLADVSQGDPRSRMVHLPETVLLIALLRFPRAAGKKALVRPNRVVLNEGRGPLRQTYICSKL